MEISFTGMTIDSSDLQEKQYSGWRNPLEWDRITVLDEHYFDSEKMTSIANEHFHGKFALHSGYDAVHNEVYTIIMFEQTNDAIMFKLMDGAGQCSS